MNKKSQITTPSPRLREFIEKLQDEATHELESEAKAVYGVDSDDMSELEDNEEDTEYPSNGDSFSISFIEFAILNEYLYETFRKESEDLIVDSYGTTDSIGRIYYGTPYNVTSGWFFNAEFKSDATKYLFQTKIFMDGSRAIVTQLHISPRVGISTKKLNDVFKKIKSLAFNNSKYKGKCLEVKLIDGSFKGIDIIDMTKYSTNLILSETQDKFIKHFINRVRRGSTARYLLNGEPGTGKTESIREIIKELIPNITFIIPKFGTGEDLSIILEACEIFDGGVIIMDDIDLYLGSRDKGSYTNLLGQFLSFFDGVRKRKISLLASTNDKGLVDKAAERPGRFNMTLDYTFLTPEQIKGVCKIHLPAEYCIDEVFDALSDRIAGKQAKITGAFIANLAENIKEMASDSENWSIKDTIELIKESYKGFYMTQADNRSNIGFKLD